MNIKTRTEHEARAQGTHDSYAEHITELLDTIEERDQTVLKLEEEISDLEGQVAVLEED